jgi:hypothetical protein
MGRRRHSSGSGFPRSGLSVRMPSTTAHSPLIEPNVRFSRIRLSRRLSRPVATGESTPVLSQRHQAQSRQVHAGLDPLRQ